MLKEAASLTEQIAHAIEQLPHVSGMTLDHPWSNDLDDGFWIEHDSQGGYLLHLSIVDVASFIRPDLAPLLEQKAYERVATLYLAQDAVLPMLPTLLSEDHLSLLEGQPRPAIILTLPFDDQLRPETPLPPKLTCFTSKKRLQGSP
jgi:ribonuclease R